MEITTIFDAVSVIDANAFSPLSRQTSLINCVINVIPRTFSISFMYGAVESIEDETSMTAQTISFILSETTKKRIEPPAIDKIALKVLL